MYKIQYRSPQAPSWIFEKGQGRGGWKGEDYERGKEGKKRKGMLPKLARGPARGEAGSADGDLFIGTQCNLQTNLNL